MECNKNIDKIRIGKDIAVIMTIDTNGEAESLEGKDIMVEVTAPNGKKFAVVPEVEGNEVRFTYYGKDQEYLGLYSVTVWENYGKEGQNVIDFDNVFELVPKTRLEGVGDGCRC